MTLENGAAPARSKRRQSAETSGRLAEDYAAKWLEARGWHLLGSRCRTPVGEVDLILCKGDQLAFVEVKMRANLAERGTSIDARRMRRVARAAEYLFEEYAAKAEVLGTPIASMQIDAILLASGAEPVHLQNIWHDGLDGTE